MNWKHIWAAGVVDGEGTIRIEYDNKRQKGTRAVIVVTNTDIKILSEFKNLYGGNIYNNTRQNRPKSKPCWQWRIVGRQTVGAILIWKPYLISKQNRVEQVLKFYGCI